MHRFKFVLYRPVQLIPVLIGISIVTFILVHAIPGDPARLLLGAKATPEAIAAIHAKYGLDRPIPVQYLLFIKNLLHGEFGQSIIYRAPVLAVAADRIAPTLFLLIYAVHPGGADGGPAAARWRPPGAGGRRIRRSGCSRPSASACRPSGSASC